MEFGCYRVTIEDPIVSGPGQEWDQEWNGPPSLKGQDRAAKEPSRGSHKVQYNTF